MYHITKTKSGKFMVVLVGKNGEPLNTSEEFPTKQGAKRNIEAVATVIKEGILFQDDTLKYPQVYVVDISGKIWGAITDPDPKYIPGKNPQKKAAKKK